MPLPRDWFLRCPTEVARELLGMRVMRRLNGHLLAGRIVETEAYLASDDSACHASRGRTPSNQSMFANGGTAYVYPIHAKHCFNVVTEIEGEGSAVLIRALEPLAGLEIMRLNRPVSRCAELTSGPAKLCQALGIDRMQDGMDLTIPHEIWLEADPDQPSLEVVCTPRIGVTSAIELPLRFIWKDHPSVSGTRQQNQGEVVR